jgi:hypothetical protein
MAEHARLIAARIGAASVGVALGRLTAPCRGCTHVSRAVGVRATRADPQRHNQVAISHRSET